jgi:RNA polymerase subunit RPABC4/transcription elongation factor Spt4
MQLKEDEPTMVYRGAGCSHCRNTGYYGRTGLFEMIEINEDIRELINQGASDSTIRIAAIDLGMRTLAEDGIEKLMSGITTLDEINRVIYVAEENRRLCPFCSTILAGEFDYCTSCGHFIGDSCVQCHRRLNSHWSYCPFCGTTNRAHKLEARSAMMAVRRERAMAELQPAEVEPETESAETPAAGGEESQLESTPSIDEKPAKKPAKNTAIDKVRRVAAAALGHEAPEVKEDPPEAA